jgi:hypothetical protein
MTASRLRSRSLIRELAGDHNAVASAEALVAGLLRALSRDGRPANGRVLGKFPAIIAGPCRGAPTGGVRELTGMHGSKYTREYSLYGEVPSPPVAFRIEFLNFDLSF